jgi:hypothetical protein
MTDISLIGQLAIILGILCLVLIVALINQVMKRKAMLREFVGTKEVSSAALTRQLDEAQSIGSIPEWLAVKVRASRYDFVLNDIITWLDYARGNLLLATVGSIVAFFGVLLAASGLLLFGVVGAAVMVVGFQIVYAAAQDAGILGGSATLTAPDKENSAKSSKGRQKTVAREP